MVGLAAPRQQSQGLVEGLGDVRGLSGHWRVYVASLASAPRTLCGNFPMQAAKADNPVK